MVKCIVTNCYVVTTNSSSDTPVCPIKSLAGHYRAISICIDVVGSTIICIQLSVTIDIVVNSYVVKGYNAYGSYIQSVSIVWLLIV